MPQFPRPISPGQVWKVPLSTVPGHDCYYYIAEMVLRLQVNNTTAIMFKIYRLRHSSISGYVYICEDVLHMYADVLEKNLYEGDYVKTVCTGLSYEGFVDSLIRTRSRIAFLAGLSCLITVLTLQITSAIM